LETAREVDDNAAAPVFRLRRVRRIGVRPWLIVFSVSGVFRAIELIVGISGTSSSLSRAGETADTTFGFCRAMDSVAVQVISGLARLGVVVDRARVGCGRSLDVVAGPHNRL
jgi:hypothetical protein